MVRKIAFVLMAFAIAFPVAAQLENVGNLDFPTSGSAEAQKHFLRGAGILHSFGWKQARTEFQAAQKLDPDFAMAYWGETLTYNHPLMGEQDGESPREALKRLGATREARMAKAPTAREKGFLGAVEELWADGDDWRARRVAYMDAMARLYEEFPSDDEVKTFYAVSILSGARAVEDDTFRLAMQSGTLALDVFHRNPKHPGAAHYVIHSFDDPIHAPLALAAAHAFADIAPAVSHAIHMPTHIFIQHGMWDKVAHQNARGHKVASDLYESGDSMGDMSHSLDWGQYGFLQLGDYAQARKSIARFEEMVKMAPDQTRATSGLALNRARYIVETEDWKVQSMPDDATPAALLANGISAVRTGDSATATQMVERLQAKVDGSKAGTEQERGNRVMLHEVKALTALASGDKDKAVELLRKAAEIEEMMRPPAGAASPIKPSHELLGEVLLEIGKPAEAAEAFEASLLRMAGRSLSLLGAARAYTKAEDQLKASQFYGQLRDNWKDNPSLDGFQEAERFFSTTEDRY